MKKILKKKEFVKFLKSYPDEFTAISNPKNVFPEYEICPLAKKQKICKHFPVAAVMDMDGTTTTTEELCLHSLEYSIRKMSGLLTSEEWSGLDHNVDYPHIIGNSTTKHVEFLVSKYSTLFKSSATFHSFIYAAFWTLRFGEDEKRKSEVMTNLIYFGFEEPVINGILSKIRIHENINRIAGKLYKKGIDKFRDLTSNDYVKIAIEIYYQRYHEILKRIQNGESEKISAEIFGKFDRKLIEPMPGVLLFISIIKGWLGEDALLVYDKLIEEFQKKSGKKFISNNEIKLKRYIIRLSKKCEKKPLKLALVTSSIFYEADIVMKEVFHVLRQNIIDLDLPQSRIKFLLAKFSDYRNIYDAFITASSSNEIRLKPHRDLYSIALYQLHLNRKDFTSVLGFEDSESGTIAMRAAGIGLAVALPFAQTRGHDLSASSYICKGGLPEVILKNKLFSKLEN